MLSTPDDLLSEYLYVACPGQIHRIDDHDFQVFVGDIIAFQVKQEIPSLHIATIGKVHAEVEFDAEFRSGIRFVTYRTHPVN